MPSLNELQKFKASFGDIGREKANLAAQKIPYNDLELPDSEPKPLPSPATEEAPADPVDDMDFGAFLGSQPDDLPEPPAAIIPENEEVPEAAPSEAEESAADLYAPEALLSNLSEELDSIPPDFPDEPAANSGLDLDSLDNFDFPEDPIEADSGETIELGMSDESPPAEGNGLDRLDQPIEADSGDLENMGDFDLPAEPAPAEDSSENLDLENMGDFDLPAEPVPAEDSSEGLDLENMGDFDLPAEPVPAEDSSEGLDLENMGDFDLPAEPVPAEDSSEGLDLDSMGDFGLPVETAPAEDSSESLDLDGMGDFGLPVESDSTEDSSENLDLENMGDFDLPAEAASTEDNSENLDFDNMGDFGISDEPVPAEDSSENLDLENMGDLNLPADTGSTNESIDLYDESAPALENMDLGNLDDFDFSAKSDSANLSDIGLSLPEGEIPAENDSEASGDFSFDELDDILKKSHKGKTSIPLSPKPEKKGKLSEKVKPKATKINIEALPDNIDEIQLSDEEFEGLMETLSRYPLNLRIACEEIIAEQTVEPKQLAELIEHLVWGASAKETATVAGRILGRIITVPKAFEKSTGAALEAEQASFAYVFVHNFLPVLRVFAFIAVILVSLFYLFHKFVYVPYEAEKIYKQGYERIFAGEYQRANEHFTTAFEKHRKKSWFYKYAEAFRDERQYIYAEQKYDELLRYYIRDKKGVLDYAYMETHYLRNYAKADSLLRNQLLDYAPNDLEGLLAAGDNCLLWGEVEPSKYEDARYYYARVMEKYGWKGPVVERMLKYFIRTDNLREVLYLKAWFDNNPKYELSAETLGELGGYLLDKKLEEVKGVPNEFVEYIDGIRDILLKAVHKDPSLPEPHYHLARYYHSLGNTHEERETLRHAVRAFQDAREESIRRLNYHIDAIQRYADVLINAREFMPAEEQLIKGINLYEDAVSRRLISRSAQYGKLYAGLGDLEYFTKSPIIGDMEPALRYYRRAEENGYAPPEMQYRMGAAYYRLEDWKNALEYLFAASTELPLNRRVLYALGNTALKRGDYFAAQGYYNRLLDMLENQRSRLPVLLPNDRPEYLELAERLMVARNNAGVASEMLAAQTGNRTYHTRAMALYAEASRAWDSFTRDPRSMIRSGGTPLPYLNSRNALHPESGYEHKVFIRIDREALEGSRWEELAPILREEHGLSN